MPFLDSTLGYNHSYLWHSIWLFAKKCMRWCKGYDVSKGVTEGRGQNSEDVIEGRHVSYAIEGRNVSFVGRLR